MGDDIEPKSTATPFCGFAALCFFEGEIHSPKGQGGRWCFSSLPPAQVNSCVPGLLRCNDDIQRLAGEGGGRAREFLCVCVFLFTRLGAFSGVRFLWDGVGRPPLPPAIRRADLPTPKAVSPTVAPPPTQLVQSAALRGQYISLFC